MILSIWRTCKVYDCFPKFYRKGLLVTTVTGTQAYALCATRNSGGTLKPSLLASPVQWWQTHPGEDRQLDFTQTPSLKGFTYLLVFMDAFTRWIEAVPIRTEKEIEVAKLLLQEIIPRVGLPHHLQSDSEPLFVTKVTQELSQVLGIKYHLHFSWRPQSSRKVE